MTDEAVCIENPTSYARYIVADGNAIAKGTILKISSDPNTAAASSAADKFAGIAIEEKVASDGKTEIGAALDGTWDLKVNAGVGVTLGCLVALSGANLIRNAVEADFPLGAVFGKALETGDASEVIRVRVGGMN
jgi:hypothetical protein